MFAPRVLRALGAPPVLLLVLAPAVSAQHVPGVRRDSYWEAERARVRSERLAELNPRMARWQEAWTSADREALEALYAPEAVATLGTGTLRGREEIAAALAASSDRARLLQTGLIELTTGGSLVSTMESVRMGDGTTYRTGTLLTTWTRTDDGWLIQMQALCIDPEGEDR